MLVCFVLSPVPSESLPFSLTSHCIHTTAVLPWALGELRASRANFSETVDLDYSGPKMFSDVCRFSFFFFLSSYLVCIALLFLLCCCFVKEQTCNFAAWGKDLVRTDMWDEVVLKVPRLRSWVGFSLWLSSLERRLLPSYCQVLPAVSWRGLREPLVKAFWALFIWLAETELGFHFFFHSTGVSFMFENWKRVFFSVQRGCVCPLAHLFLISWLESITHQKEQKNNFFLTRCVVALTGLVDVVA